jgi:hypothetical protein|tara:strand:+ start:1038 stop:1661 length:624 start_codon:yes stop_codon:yes gene_type:complete
MATTYCTVADVSDFLRIPISATTSPTKAQVEKIINRKEEYLDRRIGHTFGRNKTIAKEKHDLALLYTYGWGVPIYLQHRNCRPLDASAGDKIEIWEGASSSYADILTDTEFYEFDETYGRLYLRGYLFSIMRKNRVRVTYRYGDESVPDDVEDACVKLTCIELLNSSLRMDTLPMGGNAISPQQSMNAWKADVEEIIGERAEVFGIP